MDFTLSEEQQMFVGMFRDFAQHEVAPLAEEIDRQERAPLQTLRKAASLDLLGIALPDAYGGMNAGTFAHGLLMEELGKVCLSTAISVGAHCTAAMAIDALGTEDQKKRFLPPMMTGECIGALAVAEPDAGSDLNSIETSIATVARRQDNGVVLQGRKSHVINGDIAGVFVVVAHSDERLAAFVVEKDAPGIVFGWRDKQMGLRGAAGSNLFFDGCHVPASSRLSGDGTAAGQLTGKVWRFSRLGVAFSALGIAERGLADSVEFAHNRQQFGGPIALKQAIQAYLGEMATQIETLRRLAHYTAWQMDQDAATERDVAMLKLWAGQVATFVIDTTVQIHGGMGYIKGFHVERLYRDVRALTILEGTSEMQRLAVAAGALQAAGVAVTP